MIHSNTIIIGISGPSGSGKSLMANTIGAELGSVHVATIHEDSYYHDHQDLSPEQRAQVNYDHPASFDHDLLAEHLSDLRDGKAVDIPVYDHSSHSRSTKTNHINHHPILILEGIMVFVNPQLRELMNIKIFMDTPLDICLIRRIKRDISERKRTLESVIQQYITTVRPMYLQFIEPAKSHADIIIPRGGENRIAIDMVQAKIRELLQELTSR
jgi:uridine kinase